MLAQNTDANPPSFRLRTLLARGLPEAAPSITEHPSQCSSFMTPPLPYSVFSISCC